MARTVPEWKGKNDDVRPHQAVRDRVLKQQKRTHPDGRETYHCAICGLDISNRRKPLDHIIPLKDGGENRESNLQFLCEHCHQDKTGQENSLRARSNRVKARLLGLKEPSEFAKKYARFKLVWKKNWRTGRWEKRITELEE